MLSLANACGPVGESFSQFCVGKWLDSLWRLRSVYGTIVYYYFPSWPWKLILHFLVAFCCCNAVRTYSHIFRGRPHSGFGVPMGWLITSDNLRYSVFTFTSISESNRFTRFPYWIVLYHFLWSFLETLFKYYLGLWKYLCVLNTRCLLGAKGLRSWFNDESWSKMTYTITLPCVLSLYTWLAWNIPILYT